MRALGLLGLSIEIGPIAGLGPGSGLKNKADSPVASAPYNLHVPGLLLLPVGPSVQHHAARVTSGRDGASLLPGGGPSML